MRTVPVLLLLVGCGSSTTPVAQPEAPSSDGSLPEGAETVSLLGKALKPPALENAERTRRKVALLEAREAMRERPRDLASVVMLGQRLTDLFRFQDAAQTYTEGLAAHPLATELYRSRGRVRFVLRDFPGAIADLASSADDHEGFVQLGFAYFVAGELRNAHEVFEESIRLAKSEEAKAMSMYWTAVCGWRMEPAQVSPPPTGGQGVYVTLFRLERKELKATDVEKMIGTPGQDALVLRWGLGEWYRRQSNLEAARKQWTTVIEQPDWSQTLYILAEADLSRYQQQKKEAGPSHSRSPED
jgi:tetratricopeptide (TPR) repeat protein